MLSHPPRVRSVCHAALSDEKILRRNFLGSFSFEMIFAFGCAAVRHQKCDNKKTQRRFAVSKNGSSKNRGLVAMRTLQKAKAADGTPAERPQPIAAKRKARLSAGLRQTLPICKNLERAKGFEPSTPTLARSCSTTELHPHPRDWRRSLAGNGQSYAKSAPRMQQPLQGPPIHRILGRIWRFAGRISSKPRRTR
jgi:hypothetical protein